MSTKNDAIEEQDEKPPVFSSWRGWYWFLLLALIGWIILFYIFTESYS